MNLQEQMQQWKELRDEYESLRRKLSPPGKTGIYSEVPSYYFVDPDEIVYRTFSEKAHCVSCGMNCAT